MVQGGEGGRPGALHGAGSNMLSSSRSGSQWPSKTNHRGPGITAAPAWQTPASAPPPPSPAPPPPALRGSAATAAGSSWHVVPHRLRQRTRQQAGSGMNGGLDLQAWSLSLDEQRPPSSRSPDLPLTGSAPHAGWHIGTSSQLLQLSPTLPSSSCPAPPPRSPMAM